MRCHMFHSANDGKGRRKVLVNGNEVKRVVWANEEQGLACIYRYPYQIDRRKDEVKTMLLRGDVKVEFINETTNSEAEIASTTCLK